MTEIDKSAQKEYLDAWSKAQEKRFELMRAVKKGGRKKIMTIQKELEPLEREYDASLKKLLENGNASLQD